MINKDCNYISYKDFLDCTNKAEVKAEYINGKVFFKSPSHPNNNKIQNKLYAKLINNLDYKYEIYTSGVAVKFCKEEEMYQFEPDLMVLSDNNFENYIYAGTPKLIIEILSESTKEIDTVIKLEVYEKFKVEEYWIVDVDLEKITIYSQNTKGKYNNISINTRDMNLIFNGTIINIKDIF